MSSIVLDNVSRVFGGVTAVSDVSISIVKGVITGLIGPNGAGKTTIVNLLTGIFAPNSGHIMLDDLVLDGVSPPQIARHGIARTFQNARLLREASVLDNVMIGFHRMERTSLIANCLGLPSVWREKALLRSQALTLVQKFEMGSYADVPAGSLAHGHQRRVELMRALAMSPNFLLLDEPVAGMNDVEADSLALIFGDLARAGMGILLIEHNMNFVMKLCHVIHVVNTGRLIASGSPSQIRNNPDVVQAYLGG